MRYLACTSLVSPHANCISHRVIPRLCVLPNINENIYDFQMKTSMSITLLYAIATFITMYCLMNALDFIRPVTIVVLFTLIEISSKLISFKHVLLFLTLIIHWLVRVENSVFLGIYNNP